uniref:RGS domain-containing protein n=1 Tax=Heterorhabditis bacteriophora TaxID=37862 RepID=A0A1I7X1A9_HETBA
MSPLRHAGSPNMRGLIDWYDSPKLDDLSQSRECNILRLEVKTKSTFSPLASHMYNSTNDIDEWWCRGNNSNEDTETCTYNGSPDIFKKQKSIELECFESVFNFQRTQLVLRKFVSSSFSNLEYNKISFEVFILYLERVGQDALPSLLINATHSLHFRAIKNQLLKLKETKKASNLSLIQACFQNQIYTLVAKPHKLLQSRSLNQKSVEDDDSLLEAEIEMIPLKRLENREHLMSLLSDE